MKNLLTVFHSGSTNLNSHQQWTAVVFFTYPHHHVLFLAFMIIAMKWYLIADLISFPWWLLLLSIFFIYLFAIWATLVGQLVKNLPAMREIWVRFLGWEDPLEKERLPTPIFWTGEFQGLYSPWGHKELDMTEWLSLHFIGHLYDSFY